jgi:hypothetical protein
MYIFTSKWRFTYLRVPTERGIQDEAVRWKNTRTHSYETAQNEAFRRFEINFRNNVSGKVFKNKIFCFWGKFNGFQWSTWKSFWKIQPRSACASFWIFAWICFILNSSFCGHPNAITPKKLIMCESSFCKLPNALTTRKLVVCEISFHIVTYLEVNINTHEYF